MDELGFKPEFPYPKPIFLSVEPHWLSESNVPGESQLHNLNMDSSSISLEIDQSLNDCWMLIPSKLYWVGKNYFKNNTTMNPFTWVDLILFQQQKLFWELHNFIVVLAQNPPKGLDWSFCSSPLAVAWQLVDHVPFTLWPFCHLTYLVHKHPSAGLKLPLHLILKGSDETLLYLTKSQILHLLQKPFRSRVTSCHILLKHETFQLEKSNRHLKLNRHHSS